MNVGIPWWIGAGDPVEGVEQAAEAGADFLEISLEAPWPEELDVARLRQAAEDAGVGLAAHAPWRTQALAHPREPLARAAREVAQSCIDAARNAGARYLVFHVDARDFGRYPRQAPVREGLERAHASLVALQAGAGDVDLLVENTASPLGTPGELATFLDAVPGVGACLDPGHAALAAAHGVEGATADPTAWTDRVGDRLRALHLMDWAHEDGRVVDHLVPGAGEADLAEVVDAVRGAGAEHVLIEAFYEDREGTEASPEALAAAVERVRKLL